MQQHLSKLAPQLNMKENELTELCKSLADVINDQDFIQQLLTINEEIGVMSAENWQSKDKKVDANLKGVEDNKSPKANGTTAITASTERGHSSSSSA